jgi:TPR repeat protein
MRSRTRNIGWLVAAVLAQPANADLDKGLAAVQSGQWDKAYRQFQASAAQGNTDAQVNLGNLYLRGLGVERDESKAYEWFAKSARQGNAQALGKLGILHFYGLGVTEDHAAAADWFRKAAEKGNADAAMILAELHARGDGVRMSKPSAYLWYSIAADLGKTEALEPRTQLASELAPSEVNAMLTQLNVWRQEHESLAAKSGRGPAPHRNADPLPDKAERSNSKQRQ